MKRLFMLLLAGCTVAGVVACSSSDDSGTAADTTPPGEVTALTATAGDAEVSLAWSNPDDADFAGVTLRRSTGSAPVGPEDGTEAYGGSGSSCQDTGLQNGTQYFYVAFTYDDAGNTSVDGLTTNVTPSATAPCPDSFLGDFCYTLMEGTVERNGDDSITATSETAALVFTKTVAEARAQEGLGSGNQLYVSVRALFPEVADSWLDAFAYVTPPTESAGAGGLLAELERFDTADMYRFATLIAADLSGSTNTGTTESVTQPGTDKWLQALFENDTTADTAAVTVYDPYMTPDCSTSKASETGTSQPGVFWGISMVEGVTVYGVEIADACTE